MVHLHHGVGDRSPRHHLLVLDGTAFKGFPHVDVLQGDCGEDTTTETFGCGRSWTVQ